MSNKELPVFNIDQFGQQQWGEEFYANTISLHLKYHHFVNTPHKHDFFLCMLFTRGSGTHEVDFASYEVKPGSVFVMAPGQTHSWKLSKDIEGYIFFHTKNFYDLHFSSAQIHDLPFFLSTQSTSLIQLKKKFRSAIQFLFQNILHEYVSEMPLKQNKILALVNNLYIDLARLYLPKKERNVLQTYLFKSREFEKLVDTYFREVKYPAEYAAMMNISERHLNRICKNCVNKTTTDIILNRVILEAKRLLVNTDNTVVEIATQLGYFDNSYFTRLFKLKCKETPLAFRKRIKSGN